MEGTEAFVASPGGRRILPSFMVISLSSALASELILAGLGGASHRPPHRWMQAVLLRARAVLDTHLAEDEKGKG